MAVVIKTSNPNGLLEQIATGVERGIVPTWSVDGSGNFIHIPNQWLGTAWLRPQVVGIGEVRFDIVNANGLGPVSRGIYGVYHGRFIEMILTHYEADFSII